MNTDGRPWGTAQPERVAQPAGVFGRGQVAADLDDATLGSQVVEPLRRIGGAARADLVERERPEIDEQIVHVVGVAGLAGRHQPLQLELELGEDLRIEQLAQLLGAHEVAQEVAVEREGGGAALGERRVALVHVHRDPAEEQRLGERRGPAGLDRDDAQLARADLGEHLAERRDVEHVAQALPRRFQQHREGGETARDLEQVGGALALLPERRALAGPPAGDEQRAGRVLAELGREQRRVRQARDEELLDLVGIGQQELGRDVVERLGEAQDDAVVAPQDLHGEVGACEPFLDRRAPTARAPGSRTA